MIQWVRLLVLVLQSWKWGEGDCQECSENGAPIGVPPDTHLFYRIHNNSTGLIGTAQAGSHKGVPQR